MARRLPGLLRLAWSPAWEARRAGLITMVTLRVLSGIVEAAGTMFSLIRELGRDRTVLLITHRLAGVRTADRIYVLSDGLVVDEGTRAELMTRAGIYRELFTPQAEQFLGGDAPGRQ